MFKLYAQNSSLLEGIERVNSADQIGLVVTCGADCTCHHLSKNVNFLSEM